MASLLVEYLLTACLTAQGPEQCHDDARLCVDKLVPGTYDNSISGCLREVRVLEGLLQRKMPAVSKHLHKRDVDLIAVVPQWFLSLFSQDFPFEVRHFLLVSMAIIMWCLPATSIHMMMSLVQSMPSLYVE